MTEVELTLPKIESRAHLYESLTEGKKKYRYDARQNHLSLIKQKKKEK